MSKGMPICTVSSIRCVIPQQKHICFSKFYLDDQSCYMSVIWLAQNSIIGDVISCWRSGAPVTHVTQIFSKSSREKLLLCPLKWHYRCLFLHSESPAECIFWFLRVMCWANFFSYTSAWSASQWVRAVSSKMKMEIVKHLSDTDIFPWAQKVCNRRFPQNCLLSDELLLIICFSIYSHIKTSDCWSENVDYLVTVTPVEGCDILANKPTVFSWSQCAWCRKKLAIWATLTRATLWQVEDWVKASLKPWSCEVFQRAGALDLAKVSQGEASNKIMGSLVHVGSNSWPVWPNPTKELL